MTFWRTLLPALLICPSLTFAASKEIVELQRDLALLQEQVRSMQRSQDEKFSAIQVLVQQALDSANKTSTSVAGCWIDQAIQFLFDFFLQRLRFAGVDDSLLLASLDIQIKAIEAHGIGARARPVDVLEPD